MRFAINRFDETQWHTWFAWHPVECDGHWVWLEIVARMSQSTMAGAFWKYKVL